MRQRFGETSMETSDGLSDHAWHYVHVHVHVRLSQQERRTGVLMYMRTMS